MAKSMPSNSCKHYLILEHRDYKEVVRLRDQIQTLRLELEGLRRQVNDITMRYGAEVQFNAALCDLLRSHGISFQHVFSHDFRYKDVK